MLFKPKHDMQSERDKRGGLVSNKEKLIKIWKIFDGLSFVLPSFVVCHSHTLRLPWEAYSLRTFRAYWDALGSLQSLP